MQSNGRRRRVGIHPGTIEVRQVRESGIKERWATHLRDSSPSSLIPLVVFGDIANGDELKPSHFAYLPALHEFGSGLHPRLALKVLGYPPNEPFGFVSALIDVVSYSNRVEDTTKNNILRFVRIDER